MNKTPFEVLEKLLDNYDKYGGNWMNEEQWYQAIYKAKDWLENHKKNKFKESPVMRTHNDYSPKTQKPDITAKGQKVQPVSEKLRYEFNATIEFMNKLDSVARRSGLSTAEAIVAGINLLEKLAEADEQGKEIAFVSKKPQPHGGRFVEEDKLPPKPEFPKPRIIDDSII